MPCAPDGVAAPAEIAKGEVRFRVGGVKSGFPVAVGLFAFDYRAADPDDAIAVLDLERLLGGLCGREQRTGDECGEEHAAPRSQRWDGDRVAAQPRAASL